MELIFTMSMWFSFVASCSISCTVLLLPLLLQHNVLKWFVFAQIPDIFPYARHCWKGYLEPFNHISSLSVLVLWQMVLHFPALSSFIMSKSFVSLKLSNITVCGLWASSLLAYSSTWLFGTTWVSLMAVRAHIISINNSLSFRLWMNCSFNSYLFLYNYILPLLFWAFPSIPLHFYYFVVLEGFDSVIVLWADL